MADGITIDNIDSVIQSLDNITREIDAKIVKKAMKKCLAPFAKMAKGEVPVRTGSLKKAIAQKVEGKEGKSGKVYINPRVMGLDKGGVSTGIQLVGISKKMMGSAVDAVRKYAKAHQMRFNRPVRYGWLQELGTKRGVKAGGFMAHARTGAAEQGIMEFEKELISGVEQAAKKEGLGA